MKNINTASAVNDMIGISKNSMQKIIIGNAIHITFIYPAAGN